ncbi:MAG TPA: hypothetical protein VEC12_06435 [Bacteroidia bacterium]|nr:hypothetical protein [Bacteroidia bacterium]
MQKAFTFSLLLIVFGCDSYHSLQKGSYDIRIMSAGCCGCRAYYYNVYEGKRWTEQFVVETFCGIDNPTKHYLIYDSSGKHVGTESYIVVFDSSFIIPASDLDRMLFTKLDAIYKSWNDNSKRDVDFTKIKGFKKVSWNSKEKAHFLIKK